MLRAYFHCLLHSQPTHPRNRGFTLIELLLTIIILGILSAIALPSYLNQTNKAKGSEAKAILGAINRSQHSFRIENGTMANDTFILPAIPNSKFYEYQIMVLDANNATTTTRTLRSELRAYSSRVQLNGGAFSQIICESAVQVPSNTVAVAPATPSNCAGGYNAID